jgi:aspartate dehydrogenase
VLHGAIAALDGVSAASVDPQAQLHLTIELPPNGDAPSLLFSGSVRDASLRYANSVNVAAAAALAGPGLDAARIDVRRAPPGVMQTLSLAVDSRYGTHAASSQPRVAPGVHPVAACIVAALRRESAWLWAG